eukprot:14157831-Alexandrium_andersonii.AAC.1
MHNSKRTIGLPAVCSRLQQFAAVCSGLQRFAAVSCAASAGGLPPPRTPPCSPPKTAFAT